MILSKLLSRIERLLIALESTLPEESLKKVEELYKAEFRLLTNDQKVGAALILRVILYKWMGEK